MSLKNVIDLGMALDFENREEPLEYPEISYEDRQTVDLATQQEVVQKEEEEEESDWVEDPSWFKEFCDSEEHMNMLPKGWKDGEEGSLSDRQHEDCMAIIGGDPKLMFSPEHRKYTFAAILWGKGSGKDFICSILQAYIVHILLCMRNPAGFFGFAIGESLDILNVGKKAGQASRVYFNKFRARVLKWNWLKARYNIWDEGRRFNYIGPEYPTCKIGISKAEWLDKEVRAYSETSNPESFEGYNIIFYLCDEISGWVSPSEREVAERTLEILRTSQTSRNTRSLCGLGAAISYCRQDDDIMFQFEKEALKEGSKTYFSRGVPWDVRPKRLYKGDTFQFNAGTEENPELIDVPTELKEDFVTNPENSKCVYLLRPQAVTAPYFEYQERLDGIRHKDRAPLFKVTTSLIKTVDGNGETIHYIRKRVTGLLRQPDPSVDYVLWLDAAEVGCDASLSVGHLESVTLIEGNERRQADAVVLDQTIVWEPDKKKRHIVDIGSMTKCCLDMVPFITIGGVWWDEWNSGTGVFDLRTAGILCDRHNLTGADYDNFKEIAYTDRFIGPDVSETHKGIEQVKHLTRTRTGNVAPGSKAHKKDIADTWCGITALLLGNLISKTFRRGRAPQPIKISGGASNKGVVANSTSQGVGGSNPFNGPFNQLGKQLVTDHTDMFKGLPGASTRPGGRSRPKPEGRTVRRMPTGLRLGS